MPPPTWKSAERAICRALGGDRQPITGRQGPDGNADVPYFALEIKHGNQCPIKPWKFMEQALIGVEQVGDERVPAIAMHRLNMSYGDTLICFRLRDFEKLVSLIRE